MTFLEAKTLLASSEDMETLAFRLCMSGSPGELELYLRGHAARQGLDAQIKFLPFGTLGQHIFTEVISVEVFFLMPWDLAPECDWRSGIGGILDDVDSVLMRAEEVAQQISKRQQAHLVYLPAPIPPLCAAWSDNVRLTTELTALAVRYGATLLTVDYFSLPTYLTNGSPVAGSSLSFVAETLIGVLLMPPSENLKVVATDADNTLWAGVVGEDGVENVSAAPNGRGFRHFIYQGFLAKLRATGILLAVISRNDEDMVRAALNKSCMTLKNEDFVAVRAGYGTKSDQLRELARSLNLGIDSIVFIDDNLVELAEVASAAEGVICQAFPAKDEDLPAFLDRLTVLFDRRNLTAEDAERTEMYRRRLKVPSPATGVRLKDFLKDLQMVLSIQDRTNEDWSRAHQLINKTNQFNLNGLRWEGSQVALMLKEGGRIYTATLGDRTGSHGEIIACLVDRCGRVHAFAMSCRVFQRRVEYVFLLWLLANWRGPALSFAFRATERNEPFRNFVADSAFSDDGDLWSLNATVFTDTHEADYALFTIRADMR